MLIASMGKGPSAGNRGQGANTPNVRALTAARRSMVLGATSIASRLVGIRGALPAVLAKGGTGDGAGAVGLIPEQVLQPVTSLGFVKLMAALCTHPDALQAVT